MDAFLLIWRPHDLDTAYLLFVAGVGVHATRPCLHATDGRPYGVACPDEHPMFPLDLEAFRECLATRTSRLVFL
jgi:hypothetical protein